jgi:deazaflavin-dependent oxidoreductase (nitroreductase family)
MSDWNKNVIKEFRENAGKVSGHFAGTTLALLHTVGAKSGEPRINPLICLNEGDRYYVVASKLGADSSPGWYYNVLADSSVSVEYGSDKFAAHAEIAEEPERSELYTKMEGIFPDFVEYKSQTDRVLPVVILHRK